MFSCSSRGGKLIQRIQDEHLSREINSTFQKSIFAQHISQLKKVLHQDIYLYGGFVRDVLVRHYQTSRIETCDLDILVDESQEKLLTPKFLNMHLTSMGSPRWKPTSDICIDIVPFSRSTKILTGDNKEITIENAIESTHITTSAIAFDVRRGIVYDGGCRDAIHSRTVEILYEKGTDHSRLAVYLLGHSEKLGFNLGNHAKMFLHKNYSEQFEQQVLECASKRGLGSQREKMKKMLKEVYDEINNSGGRS